MYSLSFYYSFKKGVIKISIYQSNFLSPNNSVIDASTPNQLTATIQGSICDAYQLIVYDMSNVVKLDTTKISIASTPLYQNDTFTYTLASNVLTNGNEYTWKLIVWQGTNSATSRQTPFFCYSVPTLTMSVASTITSMSSIFTATYLQAQSIALNYWTMTFEDSLGNILLTTPNSYSGLISYTYSGFISGNTYKVYTTVVNQQGVTVQSPTYTFTVSYSASSIISIPTTTILPDLSAVQISWPTPVQITGTVSGTSSSYVNGLFTPSNTGFNLDIVWNDTDTVDNTTNLDDTTTFNDAYGAAILLDYLFLKPSTFNFVEFDVNIPMNFTTTIDYIPAPSFAGGVMVRLENASGAYCEVGYNPELSCYYYNNNGVIINGSQKNFIMDVCLIAIKGIEILIIYNNQIYEDLHS